MRVTRSVCVILAFFLLVLSAGCSSPFREAAERDTSEAWRAYLATGQGDPEEREHARRRYDDLVWEEARSLDTIAAYRRYLETLPGGRHSARAREHLEALRFEKALESDEAFALQEFLARHPLGRHAEAARARLIELRLKEALDEDCPRLYEAFLRDFPGTRAARQVENALDRLLLEETIDKGTLEEIERHRRRFSDGPLRDEGEAHARGLIVRARVLADDEESARRLIAGTGQQAVRDNLEEVLCSARFESARLRLDDEGLEDLAEGGECESIEDEALSLLEELRSYPDFEMLREAAERLAASDTGLPMAVIEAGLQDRDSRRRRISARALGHAGHPKAIAPLLKALTDRNLGVRFEASEAARRLGASLSPAVRDVYFTEALDGLEKLTAEPKVLWAVAVLLEAAGNMERARDAYRRAAEDERQVLARLRLAEIEKDSHRRTVALTGAAIWLRNAVKIRWEAVRRSWRPGDDDEELHHDISLLRQFRPLLELLEHAAELAESSPESDLRFTWLPEVSDLLPVAERALLDAEARAGRDDPSWIDYFVDEGAKGREVAAKERAEAAAALAEAVGDLEVAAEILKLARRSPHAPEAEVAQASLRSANEEEDL